MYECVKRPKQSLSTGVNGVKGKENNWLKNQQLGKVYQGEKRGGRGRGRENNWPTD